MKLNMQLSKYSLCKFITVLFALLLWVSFLSERPAIAEYICNTKTECLEKADKAFEGNDLDAAIAFYESFFALADEEDESVRNDASYKEAENSYGHAVSFRVVLYTENVYPERVIEDISRMLVFCEKHLPKSLSDYERYRILAGSLMARSMNYILIADYEKAIMDASSTITMTEDMLEKLTESESDENYEEISEHEADMVLGLCMFYGFRAMYYYYMNEMDKAEQDTAKAMELEDVSSTIFVSIVLSIASGDSKRIRESFERDFDRVYNEDSERSDLEGLRIIYDEFMETGQLPDVKTLYEEASEAMNKEDYILAADLFAACAYLDHTNPVFAYNLALSYALIGDRTRALTQYHRYLYLKPNASDREETLEIIHDLYPKESTYELYQKALKEAD